MAGYSDAAYRSVCVDEGADLCYSEMVSSEALIRDHAKTKVLLERADNETQYAIQLFGSSPEVMARAAVALKPWGPSLIDVNSGCPVPKIVKSGAGSALMRDPPRMGRILSAMRAAMDAAGMSSVPLTVKFRLGWEADSINYNEYARVVEEAGVAAITLHARTRAQGYSGSADWPAIADLVSRAKVPVFGSGDVFSGAAARRMIEETGVAGVMVARGAMGNPFIFQEVRAALEGLPLPTPTRAHRIEVARHHLSLSAAFLGERSACLEFRKHFCAYTKGESQGASLRSLAVHKTDVAGFEELFVRWAGKDPSSGR